MNKKYNVRLSILFIVGLFSLFSINISAQNKVSATTGQPAAACAGRKFVMPASIEVNSDAFGDYLRVASAPADKRGDLFSALSNEQKASFARVDWVLQLVKRPGMTAPQQEFMLDALSKVSPDTYDRSDPEKIRSTEQTGYEIMNRAFALFPRRDVGDFVEPMQMPKDREIALVQKYQNLLKYGMAKRSELVKEMPIGDRVNIWKTQLAYHLATGKFSKAQNTFILEMLMFFSPETFAPQPNRTREEEAAILSKIFAVFTKEEGYAIFMTIGIHKYVKDDPSETNNLAPKKCKCLVYCTEPSVICDQPRGCQSTVDGCGPGGWFGCHYDCY